LGAAGVLGGVAEQPELVAVDEPAAGLPAFAADVEVLVELLPQAVSAIRPAVAITAAIERRVQLVIAGEANA
jgi:ABC-type branched-subunit amino acid transport system ATPase component